MENLASKRETWKDILDVEHYNMSTIRKNNVTIGGFKSWVNLFKKYNICPEIDINLYALEFASRAAGRFREQYLQE